MEVFGSILNAHAHNKIISLKNVKCKMFNVTVLFMVLVLKIASLFMTQVNISKHGDPGISF